MNESWHVHRLSSAASSSRASSLNSSNKSHSNSSTVSKHFSRRYHVPSYNNHGNYYPGSVFVAHKLPATSSNWINDNIQYQDKRGSRSSQGSSDSQHSTKSGSSGSLLLTAANLQRFTEIHTAQNNLYPSRGRAATGANYNSNVRLGINETNRGKDAVIAVDGNINFVKTKDMDTVSVASSTHFTMVNGEGGSTKKSSGGLCSRGKQVTVLIVSMSFFFLILILGMVYALEMRAREMSKSS